MRIISEAAAELEDVGRKRGGTSHSQDC